MVKATSTSVSSRYASFQPAARMHVLTSDFVKLPLANPNDTPANQGDVVHHGIQEGTTEALYYSGVFVEQVTHGVSIGYGKTVPAITA